MMSNYVIFAWATWYISDNFSMDCSFLGSPLMILTDSNIPETLKSERCRDLFKVSKQFVIGKPRMHFPEDRHV